MASVIGNHLEGGDKSGKAKGHLTRHITGGFLTFLFAGLTAEIAPEIGAGLAVAVTTNAFFKYGLPAINSRFQHKEPSPKGVKGKQKAELEGLQGEFGTKPPAPGEEQGRPLQELLGANSNPSPINV